MKKWLCAILLVVMLVQVLPVNALAKVVSGKPITEAELKKALALAGANEGAGVYHNGMGLSASMNAKQLVAWLNEQLSGDLYSAGHSLARMNAMLDTMEEDNPEAWEKLMSREDSEAMLDHGLELQYQAEDLRQTLRYTRDRLNEYIAMIEEMSNLLQGDQNFDYEVVRYSERIRDAQEHIQDTRADMLENGKTWLRQIDTLQSICDGSYMEGSHKSGNLANSKMSDWMSEVLMSGPEPATVRANLTVSGGAVTRSTRLSTANSALKNDALKATQVHVLTKDEVGVVLKNKDSKGVEGIEISVKDADAKDGDEAAKLQTKETNENGEVYFDISKFKEDDDGYVSLYMIVNTRKINEQSADKYRGFCIVREEVLCGHKFEATVVDDDGSPYIYRASFNGYDFLASELQFYYTDLNDVDFDIVIETRNTTETPLFCYDYENNGREHKDMKPTSSKDGVYTFRDKWKKILTPAYKDSIKIKIGEKGEPIDTLLTPIPSIFNQPTDLSSFIGLSQGFGFSFTIPGINITANLNLTPKILEGWLPKVKVDIAGTVIAAVGRAPSEEQQGGAMTWKNQSKQHYDRIYKNAQKNASWSNLKQRWGTLRDEYRQQKISFLAKAGITAGVYAMLVGKWEKKEDEGNTFVKVQGAGGVTVSFYIDLVWHIGAGPVPIYVDLNFDLSVGFALSLDLDFLLDSKDKIINWTLVPDDFTIDVRITISLTIGFGVQGVASLWVKGSGYIDIATQIAILSHHGTTMIITGGASATAGVTVFWVTFSVTFWHYGPKQLYSSSSNAAYSLLDHYMPGDAKKNDDPDNVETVPMGPESYPDLVPKADLVLDDIPGGSDSVKTIALGGDSYIFYIQDGKVCWYNVSKSGLKGNVADAIATGKSNYPNLFAEADKTDGTTDYAFDVLAAKGSLTWTSEAGSEKPWWVDDPGDFIAMTGLCADSFDDEGNPDGNAYMYTVLLWHSSDGSLTCSVNDDKSLLGAFRAEEMGDGCTVGYFGVNPEIKRASFSERYEESASQESIYFSQQAEIEVGLVQAQKKDAGASPANGCFALKQWAGAWMYNGIDHNVVPKNSCDAVNSADQVMCAAGSDYARVMTDYAPDHSWIAISRSEDGEGETGVVEFYDPSMDVAGSGRKSVVLDKGNIHYFRESLIDTDDGSKARVVFYTNNAGSDEDGNRHLLNSLYLAPVDRKDGDGNFELSVDSTSYDIEMPTNSFKLETIAGALNLYWVSTATVKQDGKELDAYRVNYAVYDQGTNTLSNASVCAEFTLPEQDLVIRDLFLTPGGKGYFTAAEIPDDDDPDEEVTVSLYHFETNLMPVLDLKGQVIEDTLVCVGDFDDFSISVMNSGNMAATSFDLQVVMIVEDETTHQKTESVEGMLHADLLNPENSYMRIGDKDISTGEKAFYRLEDYDLTPQRCDWVVGEASRKYTVEGGSLTSTEDVNSQAQYVKTKVLLPGALAALKSTIQIPSTWKGDIGLELRLVKKSSYVNWVGAMATAAGKVSNSAISKNAPVSNAANTELTWELDPETGDMVLQNNLLQGPYNGLVSSVIKAPESVKTETLHDLSVDDRVYWGPDGEKWLSITVVDLAQTGESIKLTGEMYLDDDDKPIPFGVDRYYPDAVSDGVAHTFVMPLAALVDPSAYKTARVVIKGVGIEECALANNEFTLYLDGESDPLTFLKQPRDMTVQPGETVTFAVKVTGGVSPYSYQWQMWDAKHKKWKDIPGFTDASMTRENIEKKWDGCRFRCVVKDREGMSAISDEAKLTVREKVPTGDNSNLPLYLAVAAVALALLALLRRRARRA